MTTSNAQQKQYSGNKPDFCTLRGLAMYAKVFEPSPYNETYDIPARWEIDILLSKAEAENARQRGLTIREDNARYRSFLEVNGLVEKGYEGAFLKVKKATVRKKWDDVNNTTVKDASGQPVTELAPRPRVVDSHGTEIPEEAGLLIGNGSEVEVTFTLTKPQVGGREQFGKFGGRLLETKILELVEYKRPEGTFTFDSANTDSASNETVADATVFSGNDLKEDEIPFMPETD